MCVERNWIFISAFNAEDAEFLMRIGVKKIKIPSHEVANWELHNFAARNFSKCYVSLGAGSWKELSQAIGIYNGTDTEWVECVCVLLCPPEKVNLRKIELLCKDIETVGFPATTLQILLHQLLLGLWVRKYSKNISHLTSLCPEEIINLLSTNMNSKKWLNMFKLPKRC